MSDNFSDNLALHRFELAVGDEVVFANYMIEGEILYIKYVESPVGLRGMGAAGRLMEKIVEFAKNNDYKISPMCGYAVSWLRRKTEYQEILA